MISVGVFEAKTHLSSLLDKVARGQEVLITRRGQPLARLVPAQGSGQDRVAETVDKLLTFRQGLTLDGLDWKTLRDEGRR